MKKLAVGFLAAVVAAVVLIAPEVGGIATWKIVLAVVGFLVFRQGRHSGESHRRR